MGFEFRRGALYGGFRQSIEVHSKRHQRGLKRKMGERNVFWIAGVPATFATKGEKTWRSTVNAALKGRSMPGNALQLRFVLPETDVWKRIADIDNFCEPLFSEIVNRLGWAGGRRPNLLWWHAEKLFGEEPGVELAFLTSPVPPPAILGERLIFDDIFRGRLPTSAKAPEIPQWLSTSHAETPVNATTRVAIELRFGGTRVNIGNIATGEVKSVIDCLYPVLGGKAGAPEDWKVDRLRVSKGIAGYGSTVSIRIWAL